jgi:hypothetical protein
LLHLVRCSCRQRFGAGDELATVFDVVIIAKNGSNMAGTLDMFLQSTPCSVGHLFGSDEHFLLVQRSPSDRNVERINFAVHGVEVHFRIFAEFPEAFEGLVRQFEPCAERSIPQDF